MLAIDLWAVYLQFIRMPSSFCMLEEGIGSCSKIGDRQHSLVASVVDKIGRGEFGIV